MKEAPSPVRTYRKSGVTYYMTQEEYDHKEEYIRSIEEEIADRRESWKKKKEELHKKWKEERELPFK